MTTIPVTTTRTAVAAFADAHELDVHRLPSYWQLWQPNSITWDIEVRPRRCRIGVDLIARFYGRAPECLTRDLFALKGHRDDTGHRAAYVGFPVEAEDLPGLLERIAVVLDAHGVGATDPTRHNRRRMGGLGDPCPIHGEVR